MKTFTMALAAGLLVPLTPALASVIIADGHQDIRVNYAVGSGWSTAVFDHPPVNATHPTGDVIFVASSGAEATRPPGSQWDFLGMPAGDPVWILPQVQDTSLPWLGTSTEQTASGIFTGNDMKLALTAVSGPGVVSLFQSDAFGNPLVRFTTADGLSAADAINTRANTHAHYNWTFSEAGDYTLTFQASGTLVAGLGGGLTSSDPFSVNFTVVPEPDAYALAFGALALGGIWIRRRSRG